MGHSRVPPVLCKNEVKCSALDMKMIFQSHTNESHFYKKGCVLCLILKVRVSGTRKCPIGWQVIPVVIQIRTSTRSGHPV